MTGYELIGEGLDFFVGHGLVVAGAGFHVLSPRSARRATKFGWVSRAWIMM